MTACLLRTLSFNYRMGPVPMSYVHRVIDSLDGRNTHYECPFGHFAIESFQLAPTKTHEIKTTRCEFVYFRAARYLDVCKDKEMISLRNPTLNRVHVLSFMKMSKHKDMSLIVNA